MLVQRRRLKLTLVSNFASVLFDFALRLRERLAKLTNEKLLTIELTILEIDWP
jgi:hypothetical protein